MFPQHFSCIILFCGMREEPHKHTVPRMRRVMICVRISHPSYTISYTIITNSALHICILTTCMVFYSSEFLSCCPVKRSMQILYEEAKLLKILIYFFRELKCIFLTPLPFFSLVLVRFMQ